MLDQQLRGFEIPILDQYGSMQENFALIECNILTIAIEMLF